MLSLGGSVKSVTYDWRSYDIHIDELAKRQFSLTPPLRFYPFKWMKISVYDHIIFNSVPVMVKYSEFKSPEPLKDLTNDQVPATGGSNLANRFVRLVISWSPALLPFKTKTCSCNAVTCDCKFVI